MHENTPWAASASPIHRSQSTSGTRSSILQGGMLAVRLLLGWLTLVVFDCDSVPMEGSAGMETAGYIDVDSAGSGRVAGAMFSW